MADTFDLGEYGETVGATASAIEELQEKLAETEERWRSVDALLTKSGKHCQEQLDSQRARHETIVAQQAQLATANNRVAELEAELLARKVSHSDSIDSLQKALSTELGPQAAERDYLLYQLKQILKAIEKGATNADR